jgi:hypothetical protein
MRFEVKGKSATYVVKFDKVSHHMWRMGIQGWSCTCPRYVKGRKHQCKHIEMVQNFLKLKKLVIECVPCVI